MEIMEVCVYRKAHNPPTKKKIKETLVSLLNYLPEEPKLIRPNVPISRTR